jgi:hypothetical protein
MKMPSNLLRIKNNPFSFEAAVPGRSTAPKRRKLHATEKEICVNLVKSVCDISVTEM